MDALCFFCKKHFPMVLHYFQCGRIHTHQQPNYLFKYARTWQCFSLTKKCGLFLRSNIDLQSAFILSKLIQVSVRNLFVVALQWVIRLHLPLVKAFPAFWIYSMVPFQKAKNFNCATTRTSMVLSLVFYINFCVPILSQSLWSLTVAISFLSGMLTSLVPFEALKIISKSCIPAVAPSEVLNILR